MSVSVSIIVPVYNVAQYLEACFESLIKQSYGSIEIILVDDGSTDGSGRLCDQISSRDKRVVVIHKENGGLSSARNAGLKVSNGDYVLFVDADDCIKPNACESLVSRSENADLVVFGMERIDCETHRLLETIVPSASYSSGGIAYLLKMMSGQEQYSLSACRCLYRKSFLLEKGILFKEGILHEDIECLSRLFLLDPKVEIMDSVFYEYYIRSGSITQKKNLNRNALCLKDICDSIYKLSSNIVLDSSQRRIVQNFLCGLYLHAYVIADNETSRNIVDRRFVSACHARGLTLLKKTMFLVSPRLYWMFINRIKGKR